MKLKKSLLALTTATAVAMSGTAVAGADTDTDNPAAGSTAFGSSNNDADLPADVTADEKDEATDEPSGSDDFFGWDEETTDFDKLKEAFGIITVIGSAIGAIVALASNIDKLIKLFPAQ
ncbi:hypothetical protein [Corynebacterium suicordis]|uniref:Or membrane protein n=1 Tax=Corynebacterium suicordis DSM 45110 TaxID=1121369 RepID=A0ABR9ZJU2_9CORY|nr:hypothetical protein [Corynebacterium suicordis]MBF4552882.1 hypothetical protein [Corynebacterium suicordis DSM 45110]MDR6278159.1 hypothetical protein [Corynebacterium suicordis]